MHLVFLPSNGLPRFATMKMKSHWKLHFNIFSFLFFFLNWPYQQRMKEQTTLNLSCLHLTAVMPIFFGELAETNSARWIFLSEKNTTFRNEAAERSEENESRRCLGERLTLHINQGAAERTADRDVASGRC